METKSVIALGFFDGLHIGHGALLRAARQRADALGCPACLLTFDTHPDTLVFGADVPLINTLSEREALAKELFGMDKVLVIPFNRAMMEMPWEQFAREILFEQFHPVHLVCGADFSFGYRGLGTAQKLQILCESAGITVEIVEKVAIDGEIVSSTAIRQLLQTGDIEKANRFLGHCHRISGTVCNGRHLGRTIGIPTANIAIAPGIVVPKFGVYASRVYLPNGKTAIAVTNIGTRPTVGGTHITVEPWLLDFSGDLYDQKITVELHKFLRPEQRFNSLDELRAEIQRNAQETREVFVAI